MFSILPLGHVLLTNGEVNYNDKTIPLDAETCTIFGTDIRFELIGHALRRNSISYDNGHLHYAGYSPLRPQPESQVQRDSHPLCAGIGAVKRRSVIVLSLHADINDYANPDRRRLLRYSLAHPGLRRTCRQPVTPAGEVALSGEIHYANASQQSLLRSLSVIGKVASDNLVARIRQGRVEIRKLEGSYQLRDGRLQANNIAFETMGGRIVSSADIQQFDTKPVARVQAAFQRISLQQVQRNIPSAKLQGMNFRSTVDGTAEASWTSNVSNMLARTDLILRAGGSGASDHFANSSIIPVDGAIHAIV